MIICIDGLSVVYRTFLQYDGLLPIALSFPLSFESLAQPIELSNLEFRNPSPRLSVPNDMGPRYDLYTRTPCSQ